MPLPHPSRIPLTLILLLYFRFAMSARLSLSRALDIRLGTRMCQKWKKIERKKKAKKKLSRILCLSLTICIHLWSIVSILKCQITMHTQSKIAKKSSSVHLNWVVVDTEYLFLIEMCLYWVLPISVCTKWRDHIVPGNKRKRKSENGNRPAENVRQTYLHTQRINHGSGLSNASVWGVQIQRWPSLALSLSVSYNQSRHWHGSPIRIEPLRILR